jgi:hypothetical protein
MKGRMPGKIEEVKQLPVRFHHAPGVKLTLSIRPVSPLPWTAVRRLRIAAETGSSLAAQWRLR